MLLSSSPSHPRQVSCRPHGVDRQGHLSAGAGCGLEYKPGFAPGCICFGHAVRKLLDTNNTSDIEKNQICQWFLIFSNAIRGKFLYNRFNAIIEVAALSDEAITRMLTARVPECSPVVYKLLGV